MSIPSYPPYSVKKIYFFLKIGLLVFSSKLYTYMNFGENQKIDVQQHVTFARTDPFLFYFLNLTFYSDSATSKTLDYQFSEKRVCNKCSTNKKNNILKIAKNNDIKINMPLQARVNRL